MSGKRQHFIPQFLQEGFASHKAVDQAFTWVYRKGKYPFNSNIINVGVEGHFYTDGDDISADALITKAEGQFSELVKRLRNLPPSVISDPQVPELIAHLEIRTRHLRQNFLQTGDYVISRFLEFVSDEESFLDYLERQFRNDPSLLRKAFSSELAKRGLSQSLLDPMIQMSSPFISAFLTQMKPVLSTLVAQLRYILPKTLQKAAKSGHIKSLMDDTSPDYRVQRYKSLSYDIVDVPDGDLILGDSVVIFCVEGSRQYKSFLDRDDVIRGVFLPLNPSRILVGTRDCCMVPLSDLKRVIARCSLEHFIAHKNCNENNLLKEQIGADASLITKEQLEEIITKIINK